MTVNCKGERKPPSKMCVGVAGRYRGCKPYRLGDDFVGCECCVAAHESEYLASTLLHELNASDLSRHGFKALTTWGTVHDFKHILPRLLEQSLVGF